MIYRFGVFEFDGEQGGLHKSGRAVALEPQPAKALALLLSKAGDIVSREELRDAVWGADTHVDFDRGLAYCVSQIRAALGDSGENPRFVQTIPKRGFKFIAPVASDGAPVSPAPAPARWTARRLMDARLTVMVVAAVVVAGLALVGSLRSRLGGSSRVVIAVSVFDNETGNPQYDRTVAGLSDLVVEHLTRIDPRVAVIGNAAVLRQPRNIRNLQAVADGVKADYVLLGQLQKDPTGLRFITHFIRLKDQTHLKANRLFVGADLAGLETAVVEEFDRATRQHVLNTSGN